MHPLVAQGCYLHVHFTDLCAPLCRLAETEADQVGLRLMARACFPPTAAPAMLARLNAKEKELEQVRWFDAADPNTQLPLTIVTPEYSLPCVSAAYKCSAPAPLRV